MRVSMYFLHLELTFTPHYIITDKGLLGLSKIGHIRNKDVISQARGLFIRYPLQSQPDPPTAVPAAIDSKVPSDIQEAEGAAVEAGGSPTHSHREVFIRSFVFHPDLPIRIDYVRKGFNIVAVVSVCVCVNVHVCVWGGGGGGGIHVIFL